MRIIGVAIALSIVVQAFPVNAQQVPESCRERLVNCPAGFDNERFHPHRKNTPAETFIVRGQNLAQAHRFDDAIINFRKAKQTATTECESGFAAAGEAAALAAKAKIQEMGQRHPHAGQAASTEFREMYLKGQEGMPGACFV